MSDTVDVRELRVGMFVHLDMGWMSHPFPLSNFKIANAQQIAKIRELGLTRIRWSPDKSDPPPADAPPATPAATDADARRAEEQARREALRAQRAAQAQAERQYAEAAQAWRGLSDQVPTDPQAAARDAGALTAALIEKMVGQQELCIRLLTEGAGDRATAHALNVAIVALLMGHTLRMGAPELQDLGLGAMLHDIGKIDLPDRLRFPEEALSGPQLQIYREHVAHGVKHGRRMGLAPEVLLVIGQHHEQADGQGFPQGLPLERQSAAARIVALINRYDNLCNPSLPSKAMTPHEALSLLFAQGKQKFDAAMLNTFVRMMGVYPPGSLVQLTDDRYGMVVACNSSRPLKPRVLVHDARVPRDDALFVELETMPQLGIRRSLKPSQLPPAALDYLAPGRRVAYFFEPANGLAAQEPAQAPRESRPPDQETRA
jgi:putative nucleotidyltransferase with HDIG domain